MPAWIGKTYPERYPATLFEASWVSIQDNSETLEPADAFPHLGRTIMYNNSDWIAIYHNQRKAWQCWEVISKMLMKTGSTVQSCGNIYKEVVQTMLLYGSDILVVIRAMLKVLEGIHY